MNPAAFVPRHISSLKESISKARTLIKGTKRVFFAFALTFLIPVTFLENSLLFASPDLSLSFGQELLVNVVSWVLQAFLTLGFATAGLARARGEPVSYNFLWRDYRYLMPLALYLLVQLAAMQLLVYAPILGAVVVFAGGLYLMFTTLFIVDRDMNPLEAMWASALAFQANIGPLLLFMLLLFGLLVGSVFTLGVLTIWALPFIVILHAVLFLEIAGPRDQPSTKTLTFERFS